MMTREEARMRFSRHLAYVSSTYDPRNSHEHMKDSLVATAAYRDYSFLGREPKTVEEMFIHEATRGMIPRNNQ